RYIWWGLGSRPRLLHDDRWPEAGRGSPRSYFRCTSSRAGRYPKDTGPCQRRCPRRAGLYSCWAVRRRPLRQDGAQRHRVWIDAGLRRGLRYPAQQEFEGSARGRALHTEPPGYRGSLEARQRYLILAARSRCRCASERPTAGGFLWFCPGFRRGPLDCRGCDRGSGPGRRALLGTVRPVPLAAGAYLRRKDALGNALRFRRTYRGSRVDEPPTKMEKIARSLRRAECRGVAPCSTSSLGPLRPSSWSIPRPDPQPNRPIRAPSSSSVAAVI